MQPWSNFFVAEAGAAAALTGLLFVAVSINLVRILEFEHLPTRAAETLIGLVSVLVVTTFALVPGQSLVAYGLEVGSTGLLVWIFQTVAVLRTRKSTYSRNLLRVLMNQLPPLPFVIAGGLMAAGRNSGLYWIVPGILLSFAQGIFGAWVLLVEIQR
jgi:modulator of FtsH protease